MSLSYKTDIPPEEILEKSSSHLEKEGYKVEQTGNTLEAVNGRDYHLAIILFGLIILFLIFLFLSILGSIIGAVVIVIYYFTRTKNTVIVNTASEGSFTIMYYGKKAFHEAIKLSYELGETPQCPNCGAEIPTGTDTCTECRQKLV